MKEVFWYRNQQIDYAPSLDHDESADAVVVGGGMAGLFAARRLRQEGLRVILLEKDFCGAGASGKTSGFITPNSEIELASLLETYGSEEAKRIWGFVEGGVRRIKEEIEKNSIICDYQVQDSLYLANSSRGIKSVTEEFEARRKLDYSSRLYQRGEIKTAVNSSDYYCGVRFPETFGINSFLFCQGFKKILQKEGVKIFEKTSVADVNSLGVKTSGGSVFARHIIVAVDRFLPEFKILEKEVYHVQTFLAISKPLSDESVKKIFPGDPMMVWDTDLVYNYFRLTGDKRLLMGGGDLWYTYAKEEAIDMRRFEKKLSRYIQNKLPGLEFEIDCIWPGMLGVSKDLLPIVGVSGTAPNACFAAAATGLPWAAELGTYLAEKVIKGRSDFDERFSPKRKFFVGPRLQSIIGQAPAFALSHGVIELF